MKVALNTNKIRFIFMAEKHLKHLKKEVAERIKAILEEKDWFQQQLADAIGTNKANLSRILAGEVNITLETIALMESALDAPIIQVVKSKKSSKG